MVEEEKQVKRNRVKGGESAENWDSLGWKKRSIFFIASFERIRYFLCD